MPIEQALEQETKYERIKPLKILLILFNFTLLSVGQVSGPILVRLYFLHGGTRRWLTAWLLTAGFPILLMPIIAIPYLTKSNSDRPSWILVPPKLIAATAALGFGLGFCSYLYSFGMSYLPVSVSALLSSTQLAFTSVFAYFIVKQRFSEYSVNAVVMMSLGAVILGIHVDGERPVGVSDGKYLLGFFMTVSGAAIHGVLMPAVEFIRLKGGVVVTFEVLMQLQFFILMFATLFCSVPMLINGDFQAIPKEAEEFELGKSKYYMILVLATLGLQFMAIGTLGLIFSSSSLFGGIVTALLVPVQQVFAVIFLPESFSAEKGMALAMCLWGFASYFYGEYKLSHKRVDATQPTQDLEKELVV